MSKFNGVKTDNAKITAKKKIREFILSKVEKTSVLEVFCGAGDMYRDVWHQADSYTGIDKRKFFDKRNTLCGDAEKVLSVIDIDCFNVFDIDAYGSPYDCLDLILKRYAGNHKEVAFIITDGVAMDLRMGRICKGIRNIIGIDSHILKKANLIQEELIIKIIENIELKLNGRVFFKKFAKGKTGAAMKYYAIIVKINDVV